MLLIVANANVENSPPQTLIPVSARAIGITLFVLFSHLLVLRYFWITPSPEQRLISAQGPALITHVTLTEAMTPAESIALTPMPAGRPVTRADSVTQESTNSPSIDSVAADTSITHPQQILAGSSTAPRRQSPSAENAPNRAVSPDIADPLGNAVRLPNSVKLKFEVTGISSGNKYKASSELDWRHNGESYEAIVRTQNTLSGVQTMTSTGRVSAEGLAPQRFFDKDAKQSILFEAEKGTIAISSKFFNAVWQKGAQDQISALLHIGSILAGEPQKWRPGTTLSIYRADTAGTDTLVFVVEAEENLVFPLGSLQTIKVVRHALNDFRPKIEVWYASSMGYLPVRTRVTQQNGDFVEQSMSETSSR